MFDESFIGVPQRRDPSNPDHVFEVLIEYGYMVSCVGKRADLKGKRRLVGLRRKKNPGEGHAIAILENETILDSRHEFTNSEFYGQCLAFDWEVTWVVLIEKLPQE